MSNSIEPNGSWDIQAARNLYNIHRWGAKYFDINEAGHVVAKPLQDAGAAVDITDVIEEAKGRGLKFPLLIRFQDILRHRVESINLAFRNSITEFNYQGKYRGVFPDQGEPAARSGGGNPRCGQAVRFRPGSRQQAGAVRRPGAAEPDGQPDHLQRLQGRRASSAWRCSAPSWARRSSWWSRSSRSCARSSRVSKQLGVEPLIGIRARLLSKGAGNWAESGGENAKFGLSTAELLAATEMLKAENLGHCFKLLHFHIGSQVPDILTVKKAVQEAARFYAKLHKMGFPIEYLDVGGGLGVDYDGSRSAFDSSTNYTLQEYTNDIVYYVADVCNAEKVPHPDIISESGRAIVAHHSVLIVEVFGAIEKDPRRTISFSTARTSIRWSRSCSTSGRTSPKLNKLEAYHDALERKEDAQHMFTLGMMDLPDKAKIENLYWEISQEVVESFKGQAYVPEEIRKLEDSLGDQYLCNFSVFQSLLDHWALGQLFPIMPVSRLNERPTREATLVDITCDSDGQVNKFIDLRDVRDTLAAAPAQHQRQRPARAVLPRLLPDGRLPGHHGRPAQPLRPRQRGARVPRSDEPAGYYVEEIIEGNTIVQALASVQYDENELKRQMKAQIDEAIKSDRMKPSEAMRLLDDYERGLKEYTYLSF